MKTINKLLTVTFSTVILISLLFSQPTLALTLDYLPSTAEKIQNGLFYFLGTSSLFIFIFILVNLILLIINRKSKKLRKKILKRLLISFIALVVTLSLSFLVLTYFIDFLELFFNPDHEIFQSDYYIKSCYGPTCPWNWGE
jgi:amino acid transporter